ncbi:hypothetical protein VNC20_20350 [Xanthomonas arboricola pv. pruni]
MAIAGRMAAQRFAKELVAHATLRPAPDRCQRPVETMMPTRQSALPVQR